jgi:hypothetical protein
MPRTPLSHKLINERAKSVEQEVLDHHLEDEDLGGVRFERVPITPASAQHSIHLFPPLTSLSKLGESKEGKKGDKDSQNVQPPTRTSNTRPKTHRPIAKTTQHHQIPTFPIQRPPKHKPPQRKHGRRKPAHRNPKLRLIHPLVFPREGFRSIVAYWTGRDAEQAADEGAGEEEAVLRDGEGVGWGCEDLG